MAQSWTVPLVILGGRDREGVVLPETGKDKHLLRGFKAVDLEIGGRPLIELVVERWRECSVFSPILIAGPEAVYRPVVPDVRVIDTDGTFGDNLRAVVAAFEAEFPSGQLAITTCDVLPQRADLERVVDDLERHHERCDFWMLQCRVPENHGELGESAWKPEYRIVPAGEQEAADILPGHLLVVDPRAVRLSIIYRFFDWLYRTRNRPVADRRAVLLRHVLWSLWLDDFERLFQGRWPSTTWTVARNALAAASQLQAGWVEQREMEQRARKIFVTPEHRKRHPERGGRIAILDCLSLAKDIDTEEEAREIAREYDKLMEERPGRHRAGA